MTPFQIALMSVFCALGFASLASMVIASIIETVYKDKQAILNRTNIVPSKSEKTTEYSQSVEDVHNSNLSLSNVGALPSPATKAKGAAKADVKIKDKTLNDDAHQISIDELENDKTGHQISVDEIDETGDTTANV